MTLSLRTRLAFRLPTLPPEEDAEVGTRWTRRLPLRPARVVFLYEGVYDEDGKSPDLIPAGAPVARLHTWRGRVLGPSTSGLVPVLIGEVPSGRTIQTELDAGLFKSPTLAAPGALFTFRWWWRWGGGRWEREEAVGPL